jgi:hypothetical protein
LVANRLEYPASDLTHTEGGLFSSVSSIWLWEKLVENLGIVRRSESRTADSSVWNYRAQYWRRVFFSRPVPIGDDDCRSLVVLMGIAARYIYNEESYLSLRWASLNLSSADADMSIDDDQAEDYPSLNLWGVINLDTPEFNLSPFEFSLDSYSQELLKLHDFSIVEFLGY